MCDRPVSPESITLTDCLSCSGCVTIGDNDASYMKGINLLKSGNTNIIITPQVKMSLFTLAQKKTSNEKDEEEKEDKDKEDKDKEGEVGEFREFEYYLVKYLSRNGNLVIDSTVGSRVLLKYEIDTVETERLVISTICPGTVLYLSNSLDNSERFLSSNLSPIEISAKFANTLNRNLVVSIVMCKDKRVEAKNNGYINYSITAKEFYDNLLKNENIYSEARDSRRIKEMYEEDEDFNGFSRYAHSVSRPLKGSTSGGIFEGVIDYLQTKKEKITEISYIKNTPKHIEVLIRSATPRKLLQLFSSTRVVSFISKVKKNPSILSNYSYIEMNMCTGGCLYGPSQLSVVNFDLYSSVQTDKISQESIVLPDMVRTEREFTAYKKPRERKSYLVQW